MGRYLKNKELHSGSYSIRVPLGYTALGHGTPVDGLFRYNEDLKKLEYYTDNAWRVLTIEGNTEVLKDTFTGDGDSQQFGPMSFAYSPGQEARIMVYIGNVFQNPGVAFSVDGPNINFSSTPNALQPIIILHGYAGTTVPI